MIVDDTHGSGIVSDTLGMSVVRGMKEFVQCVKCVYVWLGTFVVGGEWISGLCLGFTNPVLT